MADWRKVYGRKVIESDRLSGLDFDARWLWLLYAVSQDDEGKYPYTQVKIMSLAIGTPWTWDDCQRLTTGLSVAGLLTVSDGFVHVVNGAKYNGQMRKDREPFVFTEPSPPAVDQWLTSDIPAVALARHASDETRLDKTRLEESESAPARITSAYKDEMVEKFAPQLGGEENVRDIVEHAMNHTAIKSAIDKRLYLKRWLERDVRTLNSRTNGSHASPGTTQSGDELEQQMRELGVVHE